MEKEIEVLREKMKILAEGYRNGGIDSSTCSPYVYDIILAAADVYKNTDVKLYVPVNKGERMAYEVGEEYFIPLFTCRESCSKEVNDYEEVTLQEMCSYAYDNQINYSLLSDPKYCRGHGISYTELMEYAQKNLKYEGIVLDPETKYAFGFTEWLLPALVAKGKGVNRFRVVNEETGETEHEF